MGMYPRLAVLTVLMEDEVEGRDLVDRVTAEYLFMEEGVILAKQQEDRPLLRGINLVPDTRDTRRVLMMDMILLLCKKKSNSHILLSFN